METEYSDAQITEGSLIHYLESVLTLIDGKVKEGTKETPKRWAKMLIELTSGHDFSFTTFKNPGYDQMVVESEIPFYSLCEHHIIPFFGHATVAYIPNKEIVGISKLARVVEHYARSLQVQERMTQEIAVCIDNALKPKGVAVLIKARHLCQEMRGIRKPGTQTTTSCLTGAFLKEQATREEFMQLAREK